MLCLAVSAVLFCPVPRANPAVTCCPSLGHAGLAVDWSLILNGERNGAKGNRLPSMYASCVFTASVLQSLPSSSLRYISVLVVFRLRVYGLCKEKNSKI